MVNWSSMIDRGRMIHWRSMVHWGRMIHGSSMIDRGSVIFMLMAAVMVPIESLLVVKIFGSRLGLGLLILRFRLFLLLLSIRRLHRGRGYSNSGTSRNFSDVMAAHVAVAGPIQTVVLFDILMHDVVMIHKQVAMRTPIVVSMRLTVLVDMRADQLAIAVVLIH